MAEKLRATKQRRYDMKKSLFLCFCMWRRREAVCGVLWVSVCGEEGEQSVVCFDTVLAIKPFQVKKLLHSKAKY